MGASCLSRLGRTRVEVRDGRCRQFLRLALDHRIPVDLSEPHVHTGHSKVGILPVVGSSIHHPRGWPGSTMGVGVFKMACGREQTIGGLGYERRPTGRWSGEATRSPSTSSQAFGSDRFSSGGLLLRGRATRRHGLPAFEAVRPNKLLERTVDPVAGLLPQTAACLNCRSTPTLNH